MDAVMWTGLITYVNTFNPTLKRRIQMDDQYFHIYKSDYEPEYNKYRDVEMWFQCSTCSKWFEVDEPENFCEHYMEDEDEG